MTARTYCVGLLVMLASGVVGCSETETKSSDERIAERQRHLYAERLKHCERLAEKRDEVAGRRILAGVNKETETAQVPNRRRCKPPAGADGVNHLHGVLMDMAAESYPKGGTCAVHGPFFICETDSASLFPWPLSKMGPKGKHRVLYRLGEAEGWRAVAIPSNSWLLAEWSRQITLDRPKGTRAEEEESRRPDDSKAK